MGRYKWDKTNHVLIPISNETSNFTGTAAEWTALAAAEKAKFKTVDLTDDFNGVEVIDNLSRTTYSGEPLSARMGNSLGKMVANIESTSSASQLYKVNDQFVYNGILYKVTSQIASGGAITPGSNCTPAPTVTSQISNLSSGIVNRVSMIVHASGTWNGTYTVNLDYLNLGGGILVAGGRTGRGFLAYCPVNNESIMLFNTSNEFSIESYNTSTKKITIKHAGGTYGSAYSITVCGLGSEI